MRLIAWAWLVLLPLWGLAARADDTDSVRVETLLRAGACLPADSSLVLHYARQFVGVPYVAHTLEHADGQESLVVNLRQMDCTTLVETVAALTLATTHGGLCWQDYCHWLQTLRYRGGMLDGYASRNHYFSQWIQSAQEQGLASEVTQGADGDTFPFTATQRLDLHYMSHHRSAYPALVASDTVARLVARRERETSGTSVRYIPARLTALGRSRLSCIENGDILALVTRKDGLDVSHVGLAVWGSDGLLHLLNASSIAHRVVLDSVPLYRYLERHPSSVGVRVIRLRH